MDSGLLYAEGYTCRPPGIHVNSAWCLDGETVVDPGFSEPGTAYFGVALQPGYVRRVHEAQRSDDGSDAFMYVFIGLQEEINPPLDPATDIVADLGRDIPPRVRDWALTAEFPPGGDPVAPAWVLDELLRFPDVRAPQPSVLPLVLPVEEQAPDTDAGRKRHDTQPSEAPLPMPYARYLIRRADWLDSGMSMVCSGRTGGAFSDNATILEQIQDGDSLDTVIRMADEHRPRCEWEASPGGEREHPELTVQKHAEVHLKWVKEWQAEKNFAVLRRLDHNAWDAWRQPWNLEGQIRREEPAVRLMRNGLSYEMALMTVFWAMGDEMPEEFKVIYIYEWPGRSAPILPIDAEVLLTLNVS
jgi:hypothetical protein